MLGNKEIMAQNIKLQMAQNNVNATELCKAWGIRTRNKNAVFLRYCYICVTFSVKFTTHYDAVFTRFVAPVSPKYDTKV